MGPHGHILVIDDELALRQTMARILQRAGLEVTTAGGGQEALTYLSQQAVDLVYLDIRMPDMNGLEALKTIHARFPDLPVVLFTAQPDISSAVEALREGALDYLMKPLQPEALLERTRSILARREKEIRKRELQTQISALQAELKSLDAKAAAPASPGAEPRQASDRFLTRGAWTLDLHTRRLAIGERIVDLPPTAFDYLLVLARHSPNVVDYQTLVAEAQGFQAEVREAQEIVKWHIHHIRQAIEPEPEKPSLVINVRGSGYRLVID